MRKDLYHPPPFPANILCALRVIYGVVFVHLNTITAIRATFRCDYAFKSRFLGNALISNLPLFLGHGPMDADGREVLFDQKLGKRDAPGNRLYEDDDLRATCMHMKRGIFC